MSHPFHDFFERYKSEPTETLERALKAGHYGGPGSHQQSAVEQILKERKEKEQNQKFDRDFELTQQNVQATKDMAKHTRSLAIATWVLAIVTLVLVFLTWKKE